MTPLEFQNAINSTDVYLLDVRKPDEFASGHIKNAHNLDVLEPNFETEAKKTLPSDKTIAVYCGTGRRSAMAAEKLVNEGFKVINLDGGLTAWKEVGLPLV